MTDYQIKIKSTDDIDWIIEAARDVSCATAEDLSTLKKKKWYDRLLETVTFSKDNQIRTANDICSLSKLQEIIIKALLIINRETKKLSNEIESISYNIERLIIHHAEIRNTIQRIKFGGTCQVDFTDLSRERKYIISNLLILTDKEIRRTDASKQFIGSLLNNTGYIANDITVKIDAVQSLSKNEQELLYRLIMVDRLLNQIDYGTESPVIDQLSVSTVRKREILQSVQNTSNVVPPEFFTTFYESQVDSISEVDDSDIVFNVVAEAPKAENHTDEPKTAKEEATASKAANDNSYKKRHGINKWKLDEMEKDANKAVAVAVGSTAVTCVIPIPFADAPLLIAEQVALLTTICGIYKINIKKDGIKSLVSAAFGISGATLIGRSIASSLFKFIPVVGSLAGGAISAGTASVVTLAMGKSFIEVCKATKLGTLREDEITKSKGKKMMQQSFKEQMKMAEKK